MIRYFLIVTTVAGAALAVAVVMRPAPGPAKSADRSPQQAADRGPALEPLLSAPAPQAEADLPLDSVVLHLGEAQPVTAPFRLTEDQAAAGGRALTLPEGAASNGHAGRAELAWSAPQPGRYYAWLRARWRDACGNSVSVQVDQLQPCDAGNDDVYDAWHWVRAGDYRLAGGAHRLAVLEREDGVAVDQVLLTRDADFRPLGPIQSGRMKTEARRVADNFSRSPGHGLDAWHCISGRWKIAFSFDPNRIPNQYSLVGEAGDTGAVAAVKGADWRGCRLAFSVRPPAGSVFGAETGRAGEGARPLRVGFELRPGGAHLTVAGPEASHSAVLGDGIRADQWHRIVIERWAWVLRVSVDSRQVFEATDLEPRTGGLGLTVSKGTVVFDDVEVSEIAWLADDGARFRIPWVVGRGAKWYRAGGSDQPAALIGRAGTVAAQVPDGWQVGRSFLDEAPGFAGRCQVTAGARPGGTVALAVAGEEARVRRLALSFEPLRQQVFRVGPYHFTKPRIEDPSDYLDFTPEEWAKIRSSPEADKLRRHKKYVPLVGGSYCIFARESGGWRVANGELVGRGPEATLRYSQEIVSDLELTARVQLVPPRSAVEFVLYDNAGSGPRVRLEGGRPTPAGPEPNLLRLTLPDDGGWHSVRITARAGRLEASVDKAGPKQMSVTRSDGGRIRLNIPVGAARFDDIEFAIARARPGAVFYTFDRRETDWWRTGGRWVDHGGMSCVLASHWISLEAATGEGLLWNKRSFGPDALLAFNIEENSEWFGWSQRPSHVHHPYDNIRAVLAPREDLDTGYRLEINSRNRTATVLYRNGVEVATVEQGADFPMRYVGGHAPYRPRKNRVTLVKRGGLICAILNGDEVLRWTDPEPIAVRKVGLGGYKTRVNFSHIEVRSTDEPGDTAQVRPR